MRSELRRAEELRRGQGSGEGLAGKVTTVQPGKLGLKRERPQGGLSSQESAPATFAEDTGSSPAAAWLLTTTVTPVPRNLTPTSNLRQHRTWCGPHIDMQAQHLHAENNDFGN